MKWKYLHQFADAIDSKALRQLIDRESGQYLYSTAFDDLEKFFASAPSYENDIVEEVYGPATRDYWYRLAREAKDRDQAFKRLIKYTRMMQIIIVRVWQGKVDLGLRKAVDLICQADKMYATSLELGGSSPRQLTEYVVSLLGTSGTLLGIDQKELEQQVFGDKPDFRSEPRG